MVLLISKIASLCARHRKMKTQTRTNKQSQKHNRLAEVSGDS